MGYVSLVGREVTKRSRLWQNRKDTPGWARARVLLPSTHAAPQPAMSTWVLLVPELPHPLLDAICHTPAVLVLLFALAQLRRTDLLGNCAKRQKKGKGELIESSD